MLTRELPGDLLHLSMRLCLCESVLQASHHEQPASFVVDLLRPECQRYPQLSLKPIIQTGCRNADYRIWLAIHANLLANDLAPGAEESVPHAVAKYDNIIIAYRAFFREETAAKKHRVSCHLKKTWRREHYVHLLGPFVSRDGKCSPAPCLQELE